MNRQFAHQRQVERLTRHIQHYEAISDRFSTARLLLVLGIIPIGFASFILLPLPIFFGIIFACIIAFGVVLQRHNHLVDRIQAHKIWRDIKQTHLARITLDWELLPKSSIQPQDFHPFETDLNLRNVHRLVNTSSSESGKHRLYQWLLKTQPDPVWIARNQAIIQELIPLSTFRDKLNLRVRMAAHALRTEHEGKRILGWLDQPLPEMGGMLRLLSALSVANILLFIPFAMGSLPPIWLVTWVLYIFGMFQAWRNLGDLFLQAFALMDSLERLRAGLGHIENFNYQKRPNLAKLCQPILETRPSQELKRLTRIVSAASLQRNPYFWMIINAIIPWDIGVAHLLKQEKNRLSTHLPEWLDVWFELDALSSLANFAYLNPEYTFPTITQDFQFQATALGHPLIDRAAKVCNDFALHEIGEVIIITGSNMSGKSSFLRSIGVNLVLAYMGSVVNAEQLTLPPFRVYTSIQVTDSLADGISYFYAEVKRLKGLLEALKSEEEYPLFFLIDEIFRGTNNRERLIGSQAYIESLTNGRGVGMVATHDLELVQLEDTSPKVSNYHFREDIQDGRMVFDYQLRSGPSPTTNALKIMAMEGLPVKDHP